MVERAAAAIKAVCNEDLVSDFACTAFAEAALQAALGGGGGRVNDILDRLKEDADFHRRESKMYHENAEGRMWHEYTSALLLEARREIRKLRKATTPQPRTP